MSNLEAPGAIRWLKRDGLAKRPVHLRVLKALSTAVQSRFFGRTLPGGDLRLQGGLSMGCSFQEALPSTAGYDCIGARAMLKQFAAAKGLVAQQAILQQALGDVASSSAEGALEGQ